MLFRRIREAAFDPLAGRIGLFVFGAVSASASIAVATSSFISNNAGIVLLLLIGAALGIYFAAVAIFKRKPRAVAVLTHWGVLPLGVLCLAIAIPIASLARNFARRD